jgi:hypothetical protein
MSLDVGDGFGARTAVAAAWARERSLYTAQGAMYPNYGAWAPRANPLSAPRLRNPHGRWPS